MARTQRPSKLEKLIAVFDLFHAALEPIPDKDAARLVDNWRVVRSKFALPMPGVRPSQLAAGLEEGLRDMTFVLGMMDATHRPFANRALADAIDRAYPDFKTTQEKRLATIRLKGRIASESQFMLVRHAIDLLEPAPSQQAALQEFYRLVDQYEARAASR